MNPKYFSAIFSLTEYLFTETLQIHHSVKRGDNLSKELKRVATDSVTKCSEESSFIRREVLLDINDISVIHKN